MTDQVRKLRNQFAHSLTGTYSEDGDETPNRQSLTFDSDAFRDALFTVSRIAIEVDTLTVLSTVQT